MRDYGAKRRNDSTLGQVYTRVTGVLGPLLTSERQKEMHIARVRIDKQVFQLYSKRLAEEGCPVLGQMIKC